MNLTREQKRILTAAIIVSAIGMIAIYLTFNYLDCQSLMVWSVNNWDLLVGGRISDFYTDKSSALGGMGYIRGALHDEIEGSASFLMFIPHMIWCFPLWISHYFGGNIYVGTLGCVYWYKLFLLVMTGVTAFVCARMVRRLSGDPFRACLCAVLILASSEVLLSTGYTGQDEVVYLAFGMLSIDQLLLGKRSWFLVWATLSVTCCPLFIFPLAVCILLKHKNLFIAAGELLITLIPTALWSVCSAGFTRLYISEGEHLSGILDYISIPTTSQAKASVFIILFILLAFYCYTSDAVSDRKLIWLSSLPFIWICYFTDSYYYRVMAYIPFLAILVTVDTAEDLDLKILLMTVLEYARFFALHIDKKTPMNTYFTVKTGWLNALCDMLHTDRQYAYDSLAERFFLHHPSAEAYAGTLQGLCVAIMLILMWITYSEKNEKTASRYKIRGLYIYLILYCFCISFYMLMFWEYSMKL